MNNDRKLMAVGVKTGSAAFEAGVPQPLFDMRLMPLFLMPDPLPLYNLSYPYAVADNGRRFLVATEVSQEGPERPMTVIVNWPATLKK